MRAVAVCALKRVLLGLVLLCALFVGALAGKDYYRLLGVSRSADDRQLKKVRVDALR